MGADLLLCGYTVEPAPKEFDLSDVFAALMSVSDKDLIDALDDIDPAGYLMDLEDFNPDDPDDAKELAQKVREMIAAGAQYVQDTGRYENVWAIEGTNLTFVTSGGTSWGDDPWEGWTDLVRFLDAAAIFPELGEPVGLVSGGIPSADIIAAHKVRPVS